MILTLITAILLRSSATSPMTLVITSTAPITLASPATAVQSGAISPVAMKRAIYLWNAIPVSGCALITVALGFTTSTVLFLLLGLLAIGAAVKYTFGKNPYGYAGLGDLSVFLFFGIAGVCGTFYLHTRMFHPFLLPSAIAFGLLSAGVLNVNNMRDIHNDAASGKRTLVVRMGSANARVYHTVLVLVA
ncbi:MAG: 1,4-dihydroxy-2-naphthoate octaprenyltransferase [Flavobacteriales bacterium]